MVVKSVICTDLLKRNYYFVDLEVVLLGSGVPLQLVNPLSKVGEFVRGVGSRWIHGATDWQL